MDGYAGRVVVFGGAGFVGRHICAAFARAGWEVIAVCRSFADVPGALVTLQSDVVATPAAELAGMLDAYAPDAIVNAAGSYWGLSEEQMRRTFSELTGRLLAAVRQAAGTPRYLELGTVLEYAPTPPGVPLTELSPTGPAAGYGRAKLASSRLVLGSGLDALVLRLTNSVGPGAHAQSLLGKVAQGLLHAHLAQGTARLTLAPLRAERDYLDVRDLGDAVVAAARSTATGVVNIGSGRAYRVRDLVDLIIEVSGVPTEITELDPAAGGPVAPGVAAEWLQVDPATALELLGWSARRPLRGAVSDMWNELSIPVAAG
jgi:nucleoside-diphosphate-sugar epimerase